MVVYIVLGILYESYIHPLTILSGLPSAGFGALVTLILFRMDLNIYAFVGMIMLIGIVEKNAIMQIDFALEAERAGNDAGGGDLRRLPDSISPDHDDDDGGACWARCRSRSATAPAARRGSRSAWSSSAACCFSQLVTLYLTPVVYTYMAQAQTWMRSRHRTAPLRPATDLLP